MDYARVLTRERERERESLFCVLCSSRVPFSGSYRVRTRVSLLGEKGERVVFSLRFDTVLCLQHLCCWSLWQPRSLLSCCPG